MYGMRRWRDAFTPRQLVALTTFSDLVLEARASTLNAASGCDVHPDLTPLANDGTGAQAYADSLAVYLSLAVSRQANRSSTICFWDTIGQKVQQVFARQAIPMTWDWTESNPFSVSSGNFVGQTVYIAKAIEASPLTESRPRVWQADAANKWQINENAIIATDPPYYDNIGYADLSDYFYVWLRRILRDIMISEFATTLTPKSHELVAASHRFAGNKKDAEEFFLAGMSSVIANMSTKSDDEFPVTFYYAFKQSEKQIEGVASTGWATFLEAVVDAGFQIDGTWPVRTELSGNLKKLVNALASSIVLVCRKRPANAPSVTRGEFLRALRAELPAALHTLQESAIAPVEMAQASIGPGMAVFSRYKEVLEADDTPMSVREALRIINAELDEYLARQEGDYDSYTRFAVTWFRQHQFAAGKYGEAEVLATARNVSVQGVVQAGILEARGGNVRLLKRAEVAADWDWWSDERPTIWEGTQHLIRRLEGEGEDSAARLAKHLGGYADMTRDLAYRLYQICERNKWAEEARAYNGLVVAWPALVGIASTLPDETTSGPAQAELAV
jgi:putative DNA methylase